MKKLIPVSTGSTGAATGLAVGLAVAAALGVGVGSGVGVGLAVLSSVSWIGPRLSPARAVWVLDRPSYPSLRARRPSPPGAMFSPANRNSPLALVVVVNSAFWLSTRSTEAPSIRSPVLSSVTKPVTSATAGGRSGPCSRTLNVWD